ncbi:MAG: nitroreductase [Hamadaea sp.]|uniref:Acg family FMN-binding oxidoreductase n=1 Tax=Hamadaea sp. TaxID=2024425 RepID=UPI0017B0E4AF|nr:nitroreductase [Hamadaea sp.]NUT18895.1 nitroreductase [Hamadaea sp.]
MLGAEPMTISPQDLLFEVACVACRAPSIANSQPWLWRIDGDVLELRCDQSRQLPVADPHGQLMVTSCGALLHHASVALAALGAAATIERVDDPSDPALLARLVLTGSRRVSAEDMRMHHALRIRRTDRRPFRGIRPLPDAIVDLLRQSAVPFEVSTHVFDPAEIGLLGHAAQAAAHIHAKSDSYREEMAAWTTYRDPAQRDGVPPTAAVPQVPRPVPVRDFAPDSVPLLEPGPGDDRYTTYLALATDTDTRWDWLRTGEAVSAMLLTATTLGIASSVLSEVVEVPGARALLRAVVAPAEFPQLTVRFGLNASGGELRPTARRPCSEVITIVR